MISVPPLLGVGHSAEPSRRARPVLFFITPFQARDPSNGALVAEAKAPGLKAIERFLDDFEQQAACDPSLQRSFQVHLKQYFQAPRELQSVSEAKGLEGAMLDTPALKALAFAKFGLKLLQQGEKEKALSEVYPVVQQHLGALEPFERIVTTPDLCEGADEVISLKEKPSNDLWGADVAKRHFWDDMAMVAAFTQGGLLAKALGREWEAAPYFKAAMKISDLSLNGIFMEDNEHRVIYPDNGIISRKDEKHPYLDMSVIGALLLGKEAGYPVPLDHPYTLHTFTSLVDAFRVLLPVNANSSRGEGVLMGRFPGEREGHVSVQTTAWTAQYGYELALNYVQEKKIDLTLGRKGDLEKLLGISLPNQSTLDESSSGFKDVVRKLIRFGDSTLEKMLEKIMSARDNGWMPELLHRETGRPHGAVDFAPSHTAFLAAARSRQNLYEAILPQKEPVLVPALHIP